MLKDVLLAVVLAAIPLTYFLAIVAATGEDVSGEGDGSELQTRAHEE